MSEARVQLSTEVEDLTSQFSRRIRLARAVELARAGRLLKAEALLCPTGTASKNCEELDLLARILVRQKRFVEAHRLWRKAFETGNERERIRRCIVVLQDHVDRNARRMRLLWSVGFALWVMLLIAVLVYFIWRWWS
jgi:hypothetical protein